MQNQYQQLIEVLVRQVLKKHNVSPTKDLSEEEKEKFVALLLVCSNKWKSC